MRRVPTPGGRSLRVAFVGDPVRFGPWVPSVPVRGLTPSLLGPAEVRALEALRPDVVVALDVDATGAPDVGAPVLGVAVAPPDGTAPRPGDVRPDRLVAIDPEAAAGRPLWRLLPPPVDDALFTPPAPPDGDVRVLVAQPSTDHRERLLTPAKHAHDLKHIAHGITPKTLPGHLRSADVAVVLAPTDRGRFEHAVALHLAAGHLVLTDALSPDHGLEPGLDVVHVADDQDVWREVGAAREDPAAHLAVRVRGHRKAEAFRASLVWSRVLGDLLVELGRWT